MVVFLWCKIRVDKIGGRNHDCNHKQQRGREMKPGIYTASELSNEQYHAGEGISCTGLKLVARSPAHYMFAERSQPSPAMAFGSQLHAAILEPEVFADRYMVLRDVKDRRASEYKQAVAAHGEDFVIMPKDADLIAMMQESAKSHGAASKWLYSETGRNELSVAAIDPVTGVLVRCRFDRLLDSGLAIDVKTTTDASPGGFSRAIMSYSYHMQAALYMDVWEWATGSKLEGFAFLAMEKTAPFAIGAYVLDAESIEVGRAAYRRALNIYAECLDTGEWPAYGDEPELIGIPSWAINQYEDELEVVVNE